MPEHHSDLERLKEILFEITDCKDDSQQRGWAVHDDEKAISDLLEEMLQILVRVGCCLKSFRGSLYVKYIQTQFFY